MKRFLSSLLLAAGLASLSHAWADDKPVWTYTETGSTWRGDWGAMQTLEGTISDENWTFTVVNEGNGNNFKVSKYSGGSGVLDMSTLPRFSEDSRAFARLYMDTCDNLTDENGVKFQDVVTKVIFPPFLGATTWDGSKMVPGRQPYWFNCNSVTKFPNVTEADFSLCVELSELPSMFTVKHPALTTIRLPEVVQKVNNSVFGAPNLKAIYWNGPVPTSVSTSAWTAGQTNWVLQAHAESWGAACEEEHPLAPGKVGQLKSDYVGMEFGRTRRVYVAFADEDDPDVFELNLEDWTGPYDGEPHGAVFSIKPSDATVTWATGDSEEFSEEMPRLTDVGELTVRARAVKEGEEPIEKTAKITVTFAENSWVVEPSLSKLSWKVGEEAPTLNLGQPKFGTPTANYTQATLPTAVGNYTLKVTVPASGNWTALTKSIPFVITDKSIWTFTSTETGIGTIGDGNWRFEVKVISDSTWKINSYLAGVGDLDMSALQPWEGCTKLRIEAAPTAAEGVEAKFTEVVTKLVFPSFLGENTPPQWCRNSSDNKSYCPNVTEVDLSRCENVTALPSMFTQKHAKLTTLRLPATLSSVPNNSTFTGPALNAIYWNGPVPTFTGGSLGTFWNKEDITTNYVLRANAESWAALCEEEHPLEEKKVGQLKNDYKGMHDGHYDYVYVVFTPFKEKKGMMVIIR